MLFCNRNESPRKSELMATGDSRRSTSPRSFASKAGFGRPGDCRDTDIGSFGGTLGSHSTETLLLALHSHFACQY